MRRDALRSLHKVHESSNIWRPPLLLEQYFRVSLTRNAIYCTNQRALWITLVQTATPKARIQVAPSGLRPRHLTK
jgi:hypothetical protein